MSNQYIEHVVLYKTKPGAHPSTITAMLANLNTLATIPSVLRLSCGPLSGCRSDSLTFTHMLHARYQSKPDLITYSENPTHINVVRNYVKPVVDDIMAVDWVADDDDATVVPPGSAMRVTMLKLREGTVESEKRMVMEVMKEVKKKSPCIVKFSIGDNFSPGRAKGYSICSIAVFKEEKELVALDLVNHNKVVEFLDDFVVLDYVVPPSNRPSSM